MLSSRRTSSYQSNDAAAGWEAALSSKTKTVEQAPESHQNQCYSISSEDEEEEESQHNDDKAGEDEADADVITQSHNSD